MILGFTEKWKDSAEFHSTLWIIIQCYTALLFISLQLWSKSLWGSVCLRTRPVLSPSWHCNPPQAQPGFPSRSHRISPVSKEPWFLLPENGTWKPRRALSLYRWIWLANILLRIFTTFSCKLLLCSVLFS